MIEIEDEYSESWAELTQCYYDEENDESYAEDAVSVVFPDKRDEVHYKRPDFSRRFEGASTSEFEKEYPSIAESAWIKQRERDFDARSQLNRSRRGDYHGDNGPRRRDHRWGGYRDNVPWRRDHSRESYDDSGPNSYRPRYTNRSAETSPFRSPLNRTKRVGNGDLDNGNNFRFPSCRRGDGRPNSSNNNRRSCRRLYSPTQGEDETNNRVQVVTKDDVKLARREKDIAYGKNTDDYKTYLQVVPKHRRSKDRRVHPRTPDKFENCARRSWDGQVKVWKLNFHAWAANYHDTGSRGDCSQKSSCSEGTTLTSEHTSVKEEDNLTQAGGSVECSEGEDEKKVVVKVKEEVKEEIVEVIEDNVEYIDEEAAEIKEEKVEEEESYEKDDDTFLDAVDYILLVGNQED